MRGDMDYGALEQHVGIGWYRRDTRPYKTRHEMRVERAQQPDCLLLWFAVHGRCQARVEKLLINKNSKFHCLLRNYRKTDNNWGRYDE